MAQTPCSFSPTQVDLPFLASPAALQLELHVLVGVTLARAGRPPTNVSEAHLPQLQSYHLRENTVTQTLWKEPINQHGAANIEAFECDLAQGKCTAVGSLPPPLPSLLPSPPPLLKKREGTFYYRNISGEEFIFYYSLKLIPKNRRRVKLQGVTVLYEFQNNRPVTRQNCNYFRGDGNPTATAQPMTTGGRQNFITLLMGKKQKKRKPRLTQRQLNAAIFSLSLTR